MTPRRRHITTATSGGPATAAAIAIALGSLACAGCGTTGLTGDQERQSYILVSEGKAGALVAPFTSNVRYCKATSYNLGGTDFVAEISYDGERCTVTGTAQSRQP